MERDPDEITPKYRRAIVNDETEDLPFEATDIMRGLRKQKSNLKNTEYKLELPKIELQKFPGDSEFTEWHNFKELSEDVHDRKDNRDSEKLNYLKLCLQGDARLIVSNGSTYGFLTTEAGTNYYTPGSYWHSGTITRANSSIIT